MATAASRLYSDFEKQVETHETNGRHAKALQLLASKAWLDVTMMEVTALVAQGKQIQAQIYDSQARQDRNIDNPVGLDFGNRTTG